MQFVPWSQDLTATIQYTPQTLKDKRTDKIQPSKQQGFGKLQSPLRPLVQVHDFIGQVLVGYLFASRLIGSF